VGDPHKNGKKWRMAGASELDGCFMNVPVSGLIELKWCFW
jgi:hypothetical protein